MNNSLILTLIGPDKPGLVEMVSATLAEHHASWQQSSMSRLAGKFAGILIASVDSQQLQPLTEALSRLESKGLKITIEADDKVADKREGQAISLELIGHDKPGIVRHISQALASHGISVDRLETAMVSGSMSAEQLFKAEADLLVPTGVDIDELQDTLEAIASDLMVDITLNN
ncbi:MAG: ACT domain-containing protein [Halopseudomonas sp.]